MVNILADLIENHGARFVERTPERMVLSIGPNQQTDIVVFDEELRNFFTDFVRGRRGERPTNQHRIVIYRIFDPRQPNINYVGQTTVGAINRYDQHLSQMPSNVERRRINPDSTIGGPAADRPCIPSHGTTQLAYHAHDNYPGEEFEDLYEMEVIRGMPNHGELRNQEHKRVRRAWEMFYQWVYGTWHKHRGANRK